MKSQRQLKPRAAKQNQPRKKVFVGMSGGVDSSVSAALLKKSGYEVTGVFIKTWTPDWFECTAKDDRLDAMRVCAKLGIPFLTLDLEKEYKRAVVDYMITEYKKGKTPNPDVMCNKHIKFGAFFNWAVNRGADFVATGHYARIKQLTINNLQLTKKSKTDGKMPKAKCFSLFVGADENKDQSYFLWTLTQKQLAKTLFPVGNLRKPEVRKLAKKFGLPTADKKDSQGLCFMGKIDIKDFLSHFIVPKRGNVLDETGEKIGYHDGAVFLTIGERRGFVVTKKTPNDSPYFIIAKDIKKNSITVSHKSPAGFLLLSMKEAILENVNWILDKMPAENAVYEGRVRYRQEGQQIKIKNQESKKGKRTIKVIFEKPQITAPGQSLVIYDGGKCLGGGVIA